MKKYLKKIAEASLPATAGIRTIFNSHDIFFYRDPDLKDYGFDEFEDGRKATKMEIFMLQRDGIMFDILTSLSKDIGQLTVNQEQIAIFCNKHRNLLNQKLPGTYFVIRKDIEFFLIQVFFNADKKLLVFLKPLIPELEPLKNPGLYVVIPKRPRRWGKIIKFFKK